MKKVLGVLVLLIILAAGIGYYLYNQYVNFPILANQEETQELYIEKGTDFNGLIQQFNDSQFLSNIDRFKWLADKMSFNTIKSGHYQLGPGITNVDLVRTLRAGRQTPIKLVVPPTRSVPELAGKVAAQIAADSLSILELLNSDSIASRYNLNTYTLPSMIIPNTYEVYWDMDSEDWIAKMHKEHTTWWSKNNRLEKAKSIGYSPEEISTIASIVERETNYQPEKSRVAGVYINRLKRGIPLQADPTVVYALGDFSIRRVLNKYLEIDSPYNTYKYPGLPPGPIGNPSRESIDATLNFEEHNYLYFCAKADDPGKHAFARTLTEHNRNARKFQNWMNRQGIYK